MNAAGRRRAASRKDPYVSLSALPSPHAGRGYGSTSTARPGSNAASSRVNVNVRATKPNMGQWNQVDAGILQTPKASKRPVAAKQKRRLVKKTPGKKSELWCLCQQENDPDLAMVQCEYKKCPIKWYHLQCLGLTVDTLPEGKFYCEYEGCQAIRWREKGFVPKKRTRFSY